MAAYPMTALPQFVTPGELAEADGPRVLRGSTTDLGVLESAGLVWRTRTAAGHTITGSVSDLIRELLGLRADFSSQAVPYSPEAAYQLVLDGCTEEVAHRCAGDVGVALDRFGQEPDLYWLTYDIDPDGDANPRAFADEAPARLDFLQRVAALEERFGRVSRC